MRPASRARTTYRSAKIVIFCGRLCRTAGRDRTATGQPRRSTMDRTCPARAPQARTSTLCLPGGTLCSLGTPQTPVALTPRWGEVELRDEAVVEVGAVGELDIPHLLQQ